MYDWTIHSELYPRQSKLSFHSFVTKHLQLVMQVCAFLLMCSYIVHSYIAASLYVDVEVVTMHVHALYYIILCNPPIVDINYCKRIFFTLHIRKWLCFLIIYVLQYYVHLLNNRTLLLQVIYVGILDAKMSW